MHRVPCKGICPRLFRVQKPCTADTSECPRLGKNPALHPSQERQGPGLSGGVRGPQVVHLRGHAMELICRASTPFPPSPVPWVSHGRQVAGCGGGGTPPLSKRAAGAGMKRLVHTVAPHAGVGGRPPGVVCAAGAERCVQGLVPLHREPTRRAPVRGLHLGLYRLPLVGI